MPTRRSESSQWIESLLEAHADEIRDRDLRVRVESDPRFQIEMNEKLEAALIGLLHFVFSTVPDGCEIFIASVRGLGPVESLGSGSLALRWQVTGPERSRLREKVTSLRPIAGSAQRHAGSGIAVDLKEAFDEAGWDFELLATADDRELRASASTR